MEQNTTSQNTCREYPHQIEFQLQKYSLRVLPRKSVISLVFGRGHLLERGGLDAALARDVVLLVNTGEKSSAGLTRRRCC